MKTLRDSILLKGIELYRTEIENLIDKAQLIIVEILTQEICFVLFRCLVYRPKWKNEKWQSEKEIRCAENVQILAFCGHMSLT